MPSSYVDSFAPIIKMIIERAPKHVLDIGPGWGKYGLACREYLPGLETLDAIEVPQGRIRTQPAIYDAVFIGDARDATEAFFRAYDLVLLIDVIEHFPKRSGHALLDRMQRAGPEILIATPTWFFEQHDEANPHEEHLSLWGWDDLAPHGVELDVSTPDAVIYLIKGMRF